MSTRRWRLRPHTTRAGFLFYDVEGLANPLAGGKLNLRMLRNADGKELFYFEIPFDKYLHGACDYELERDYS